MNTPVFVVRADALAQRAVDTAAIFLMRLFGVGKGPIRYALWLFQIVLILLPVALPGNLFYKFLTLVCAAFLYTVARAERAEDDRAESGGHTASAADRFREPWYSLAKAVMAVLSGRRLALCFMTHEIEKGMTLAQAHRFDAVVFTIVFTILLHLYLLRTPIWPPAKQKKKELTALVPLRAGNR